MNEKLPGIKHLPPMCETVVRYPPVQMVCHKPVWKFSSGPVPTQVRIFAVFPFMKYCFPLPRIEYPSEEFLISFSFSRDKPLDGIGRKRARFSGFPNCFKNVVRGAVNCTRK